MAQYGEQRYPFGGGSERSIEQDRGGRHWYEGERDWRSAQQHRGSGAESFNREYDPGHPFSHGGYGGRHGRDEESRDYGRGRQQRPEDEAFEQRGYYRQGSGFGGYGSAPGEAGGSLNSGRSYSAEPGWGPGYGEFNRGYSGSSDYRSGSGQRGQYDYERGSGSYGGYGNRWNEPQSGEHGGFGASSRAGFGRHEGGAWGDTGNPVGGGYMGERSGRRQWRGPKGYQRSDERLKEDISERLMSMGHYVDASDVSVEVKDGKVSLEGSVPERRMKHAIEDLVDDCMGVKDIDNRVRVKHVEDGQSDRSSGKESNLSIGGGSQSSISGMGTGSSG
jgi:hypothetical protein